MIGGIKKLTKAEQAEQYRQDRWAEVNRRWLKLTTKEPKNKPVSCVK